MIPKVIHYCWFGGNQLPKSAVKCINSWRKFFPDYEIKEWNETNFDVNIIPYTSEAYRLKKYAFVSDYARLWILYRYGGVYFDTDVEVIKGFDDILTVGPFMGCENPATKGTTSTQSCIAPGFALGVNPGLGLGAHPGLGLYKELIDFYENFHFLDDQGNIVKHTIVSVVTDLLCKKGLKNTSEIQFVGGVYIYPDDYFCPYSQITGKLTLTNNSHSIHLYDGSWLDRKGKISLLMRKYMGIQVFMFFCKLRRFFKK